MTQEEKRLKDKLRDIEAHLLGIQYNLPLTGRIEYKQRAFLRKLVNLALERIGN
jgi:hypothetical protein